MGGNPRATGVKGKALPVCRRNNAETLEALVEEAQSRVECALARGGFFFLHFLLCGRQKKVESAAERTQQKNGPKAVSCIDDRWIISV
jgi:hypothetical protein